jgi:hypothetical protein
MANMITKPGSVAPSEFEAEQVKMLEGVQGIFPASASLTIGGAVLTQAAIAAKLQGPIANSKAVTAAYKAFQAAVAVRRAETIESRGFYKQLKAALKVYYGPQAAELASFGIPTDKAIQRTAQQQTVAVAKRRQTRAVRGTKGKKQKAALTVAGNPPIYIASDGTQTINPPPINVSNLGPAVTISAGGTGNGSGTPPKK